MADPDEVAGFRFTPQVAAFLAVIALMAAALGVSSPIVALGLGAFGVLTVPLVALRAALRRRRSGAWRVTPAEGALGLSGLLVGVAGAVVFVYIAASLGLRGEFFFPTAFWPHAVPHTGEPVGSRSVSYSDPEIQKNLKEELAKAGIPFTVRMRDGKEWIGWRPEHHAAAEAIERKVREGPVPPARSVFFPDPEARQRFTDWLTQKGIKYRVAPHEGREHVVLDDTPGEDMSGLMQEYMARRSAECPKKKQTC